MMSNGVGQIPPAVPVSHEFDPMTGQMQTTYIVQQPFFAGSTAASFYGSAIGASVYNSFQTPAQVDVKMEVKLHPQTKDISPALYMRFVKSKLNKVEQDVVRSRLKKLGGLIAYSEEMGQRALYEQLCSEVAILAREAELVACGIDKSVTRKDIEKFIYLVKDRTIKFDKFEKFPRVVPKNVQEKIKDLQKKKIIDGQELWILYVDYTKEELKTSKEKIRNKDPILFVEFSHQKDVFYFVADWVDEYCDLTFDKFVKQFKAKDPEFGITQTPEISEDRWKKIVEEAKERADKLAKTNGSNWRELEKDAAVKELLDKERKKLREEERKILEEELEHEQEKKENMDKAMANAKSKKKWWKFW